MIHAINTSDPKIVTVSLKEDKKILKSLSEENEYGSQVLLPLIMKLLPPRGWDVVDEIEVDRGPGSYTGIRVGVSVANALGFALNIPVNGKKMETSLKY
ncbi:MAG: Universal bacterial protein YeaZ [Candidatus Daviesbacteria bacterium GW2011_GWB1_41_5]|uniref:Universal bacterial protein YeaZ n=1 Tax=Candidatus Daviesbacteria bacterium GW2011_GWB1_41_5 TaxID=1618429 RepID=A0A0G0WKV0_9BACT|nr:MAG: Universal bacterial protein YeaZ [Candidatus Daviesbacteria bacterium GW2011_GWB1_41_5]